MIWNEENINTLILLVENGLKPFEIAEEMNTTRRSITNKMSRLNLKVKFKIETNCKECGKIFDRYIINSTNYFCSSKCSTTFNNRGKIKSIETKNKISKSLLLTNSFIPKKKKIKKLTPCKFCNKSDNMKKYKSICDVCRIDYYKFYRPSCLFKFNIHVYPNEFNMNLVEEHGWYSPVNRNNNIYGVSKDHIYSIMDGFKNGISPEILSHPANCQLLLQTENFIKKDTSDITLEELKIKIFEWNKKYGTVANVVKASD